jgi:hypothetical protein
MGHNIYSKLKKKTKLTKEPNVSRPIKISYARIPKPQPLGGGCGTTPTAPISTVVVASNLGTLWQMGFAVA